MAVDQVKIPFGFTYVQEIDCELYMYHVFKFHMDIL